MALGQAGAKALLIHQAVWIGSLSVKSRLFLDVASPAALHLIDAFIHDFSTETDRFSPDGAFRRLSLSSFEWMNDQREERSACAASRVGSDLGLDSGDFLDAFLQKTFDSLMQGVRT